MRTPIVPTLATLSFLARLAHAATPPCGTTIDPSWVAANGSTIEFDRDMVCPSGSGGTALVLNYPGLTVKGNGYAIRGSYGRGVGGTTNNSVIEDLDVSGPAGTRQGEGIYVVGAGNTVRKVNASNRHTGIRLTGGSNTVEQSQARDGYFGVYLDGAADGGCVVRENDLRGNVAPNDQWGTGLYLNSYRGSLELAQNDFRGSQNAIRGDGVRDLTIDNATAGNVFGDNPVAGIRFSNAQNVTVANVDVSDLLYQGRGVFIEGGSSITLHRVRAKGRYIGAWIDGANTRVEQSVLSGNRYGVSLLTGPATVLDNDLTGNANPQNGDDNAGLAVSGFVNQPLYLGGNDYTGSWHGLVLSHTTGLVIDGDAFLAPEKFWRAGYTDIRIRGGSDLTIRNLDLSGAGRAGRAIYGDTGMTNLTVENVQANDREVGVHANGVAGIVVRGVEARRTRAGVWITGTGATIENNVFTDADYPPDRSQTGSIYLRGYTGPIQLAGNDFRGSYAAIRVREGVGITLDNATAGNLVGGNPLGISIDYLSYGNTVRNWNLSGEGSLGTGVSITYLSGGNVVEDVVADGREYGFNIEGADSRCDRCQASGGVYGIRTYGMATVRDGVFRNNRGHGVWVQSFTGAPDIRGNVITGNGTGLLLYDVQDFKFDNGTGEPGSWRNDLSRNATTVGLYSSGSMRNVTIQNLDASGLAGDRSGYGINTTAHWISGLTVKNVRAHNRQYGALLSGRDILVERFDARGSQVALYLTGGPAEVRDSDLSGAGTAGLWLLYFYQNTLRLLGNDFRGSVTAVRMQQAGPMVLDMNEDPDRPNRYGDHNNGVYSDWSAGTLLVKNFKARGLGGGYGVYHEFGGGVVNVDLSRFQYGVRFGSGAEVKNSALTDNGYYGAVLYSNARVEGSTLSRNGNHGLAVYGSGLIARGNDLTQNGGAALYLDQSQGEVAFSGNDLRGSAHAFYVVNTTGATFELEPAGEAPNVSGGHSSRGVYASNVARITFRGPWDFDGSGGNGYGVEAYGANVRVEGVKASGRQRGVYIQGVGAQVVGVTASQNLNEGIYLVDSRDAVVVDNVARNNGGSAVRLDRHTGVLTFAGNDLTGSTMGFYGHQSPDLVIEGRPAGLGENVFGEHLSRGVLLDQSHNALVRGLNLLGLGTGQAVDIHYAQNALVEDIVASGWGEGVRARGSYNTVRGALLRENVRGAYFIEGAVNVIESSRICWNLDHGVRNDAPDPVDARGNYWGTASGPRMPDNPGGTANPVYGNVIYKPFLTTGQGCESRLPVRTLELSGLTDQSAGTPQTLTVRALDIYGALVNGYTGTVEVVSSDGAAVIEEPKALVGGVGTFAVTLNTVGAHTVSAQDVANPQIQGTMSVRALVGAAARLVLVSGGGQTGEVGKPLGAPLRVWVTDGRNNGVPNFPVTFSAVTSGASVQATQVFTDADGYAMTTATLSTVAGPQLFQATASGAGTPLEGSPAEFAVTARPGPTAQLMVLGLPASAAAGTPVPFSVEARDAYGNLTPDYTGPVIFASSDTQATLPGSALLSAGQGAFSATFRTAGAQSLGAADALFVGVRGGATLTVTAGAPARLSLAGGNAQVAVVGEEAPLPLAVKATDAHGNPVGGVEVTFAALGQGSVAPAVVTTGADGLAQAVATLGPAASANDFAAAAEGLEGSPVRFQLIGRAGPPARLIYISGGGQAGEVGSRLLAPLVVLTADAYGNELSGITVRYNGIDNDGEVEPQEVVSDGSGHAQAWATLGSRAGVQSFEARGDFTQDVVRFDQTAVRGAAARIELAAGDGQVGAPGALLADKLAVRVLDAKGNPVPGVVVAFSAEAPEARVEPAVVVTGEDGRAETSARLGIHAGEQIFSAAVPGLDGSPVVFKAAAQRDPGKKLKKISITVSDDRVVVGTPTSVVAQLEDEDGNPVPEEVAVALQLDGEAVFQAASLGGVEGVGTERVTGTTDERGRAQATLTTLRAGKVTVAASGGGLDETRAEIVFVAAAADRLALMPVDGTRALACECLELQVQLTDRYGNPVGAALGGVKISVTGTALVSATTLSGASELPAPSVTGRLNAQGGARVEICGDGNERVAARVEHASFPGRGGEVALDFELGPFSAENTLLGSDAEVVQARLGTARITVVPRDVCGNDLGPGLDVELRATAGVLSAVEDLGDGTYAAALRFPSCPEGGPGEATVTAQVGGEDVDAALTVGVTCAAFDPGRTEVLLSAAEIARCDDEALATLTLSVLAQDEAGGPLREEAAVAMTMEDLVGGAFALEGDAHVATFTAAACSASPRALTVTVNGVDVTPEGFSATFRCPAVDPAHSGLLLERSELRADGVEGAKVSVAAVTECGEPARGRPVKLRANLGTLEHAEGALDQGGVFETRLTSFKAGEDTIFAVVDGVPIGERAIRYVAPPAPRTTSVSEEGCGCGSGGVGTWPLLLVLAAFLRRRRRSGRQRGAC